MALEPRYRKMLKENDFLPKICNQNVNGFWDKAEGADFIILFVGTTSHSMAIKARKTAAARGIPLVTVPRSSISALKKSIADLRARSVFAWNDGRSSPGSSPASTLTGIVVTRVMAGVDEAEERLLRGHR